MAFLCIAWAPDGWRSRTFHEDAAGPDRGYTHQPNAAVAQLARASACHAEGREFESLQPLLRKALQTEGFFVPASASGALRSETMGSSWAARDSRAARLPPPGITFSRPGNHSINLRSCST